MWPQCELIAIKKWTVAKRLQRSLKGFAEVATSKPNQSRGVFELAQKTGHDWFGRSEVLLVSERSQSGLIFISDWLPTVRQSVSSRKGWGLFAIQWRSICDWSVMRRWLIGASSVTCRHFVAEWFPSVRWLFADGFASHWPVGACSIICHIYSQSLHRLLFFIASACWGFRAQTSDHLGDVF